MPTNDGKGSNGIVDLDPVTDGDIGQSRRAARQARLDAQRNRRMIDIPVDLEEYMVTIADDLSIPVSQLIARLVWEGLEHVTIDQLKNELQPTLSMRFLNALPYTPKRNLK